MKTMIHIPLIAFLLSAFSCSKQEVPDVQEHDYWDITIDDSLYNHLSGPDANNDPIYGLVTEDYHGPVRIENGCLMVPVSVGKFDDIEYKLVWNGSADVTGTIHLYLYMVNHNVPGIERPLVGLYARLFFDLSKKMDSDLDYNKIHFHFYDRYNIEVPM